MKNITKIAAAFIIVAGIVGLIKVFTPGVTTGSAFAKIVEPLLNARTYTFKYTYSDERNTITSDAMYMEPKRVRLVSESGIIICDWHKAKCIQLHPDGKIGMLFDYKNADLDKVGGMFGILQFLSRIRQIIETEDTSIEFLGVRQIDGRLTHGYLANSDKDGYFDITFWADPKTNLPVKIEMANNPLNPSCVITMSDFIYNVDMDESLFSLEPPEGYSITTITPSSEVIKK